MEMKSPTRYSRVGHSVMDPDDKKGQSADASFDSTAIDMPPISGAEKEKIEVIAKSGQTLFNSNDTVSRNFKLLFCFLGLQVSYLLWGITQVSCALFRHLPRLLTASLPFF
jgi:hypothetical protein